MAADLVPLYNTHSSRIALQDAAIRAVEAAARRYAAHTHGNLNGDAYRRREEARDQLLDALATLDASRGAL